MSSDSEISEINLNFDEAPADAPQVDVEESSQVDTGAEDVAPLAEPEEPEAEEKKGRKKPGQWNIFMVLLAISLLAICVSILTLFLYLNDRFGSPPWWETKDAAPSETDSYNYPHDKISLNRTLA